MALPNKFRKVSTEIYAGAMPSLENIIQLKKQYNIKYILTLNEDGADKVASYLNQINTKLSKFEKIKQIIIPISPSVTIMDDNLKKLIRNIREILDGNQPIYIHCLQGQDRTGLAIGIYLIKKFNKSFEDTLSEIKKYGFGNGINKRTYTLFITILKTLSQHRETDISSADDAAFLARQTFLSGLNPQAQGIQSFAPFADMPYQSLENFDKFLEEVDSYDGVPMMGSYHNMGPMRGSGPVENSAGGIINILDGLE